MRKLKPYTAGITVAFDIDFDVMAISEEHAREKIENLLELINWQATIDCGLPCEYDVHVNGTNAKLNAMYI